MAVIGKIRSNVSLLIFVIAIAMLAFLMMDALSSSTNSGGQEGLVSGTINGKEISSIGYQQKVEQLNNQQQGVDDERRLQIREQAWDAYVQDIVAKDEFSKLGLALSDAEVKDVIINNPSLRSSFQDETGAFSMERFSEYLDRIKNPETEQDRDLQGRWMDFETQILDSKLRTKYQTMIRKAAYAPSYWVEMDNELKTRSAEIDYVFVPYTSIPDADVSITDADLSSYLNANRSTYSGKKATRSMEYVVFPVKASKADTLDAQKRITAGIADLKSMEDAARALKKHASETPFTDSYFTSTQLNSSRRDTLFTLKEGEVYGPYYESGSYKAAKAVKRVLVADSAQVQVITRNFSATASPDQVKATADSIYQKLQAGASFAELAEKHSEHSSKTKGGDLGYIKPGSMPVGLTELNNAVFYEHGAGDTFVQATNTGVSVVRVNKANRTTPAIQFAFLTRSISASKATRDMIYQNAKRFAGENRTLDGFRTAAGAQNLAVKSGENLEANDYKIDGLGVADDLINWAFKPSKDEVSDKVFSVSNKVPSGATLESFVVAAVTARTNGGAATVESVRSTIEPLVRNQKKAAKILEKIGSSSDLNAVASAAGQEVKSASAVTFNATSISGIGNEPAVQSAIFGLADGAVSSPIEGARGVYVVKAKSFNAPSAVDVSSARKAAGALFSNGSNTVFQDLVKSAEVEDTRYKTRDY